MLYLRMCVQQCMPLCSQPPPQPRRAARARCCSPLATFSREFALFEAPVPPLPGLCACAAGGPPGHVGHAPVHPAGPTHSAPRGAFNTTVRASRLACLHASRYTPPPSLVVENALQCRLYRPYKLLRLLPEPCAPLACGLPTRHVACAHTSTVCRRRRARSLRCGVGVAPCPISHSSPQPRRPSWRRRARPTQHAAPPPPRPLPPKCAHRRRARPATACDTPFLATSRKGVKLRALHRKQWRGQAPPPAPARAPRYSSRLMLPLPRRP